MADQLSNLPDEVHLNIFERLPLADCASLHQVNKHIRLQIGPILYRRPLGPSSRALHILLLLRALLSCPKLGEWIEHLVIGPGCWGMPVNDAPLFPSVFSAQEQQLQDNLIIEMDHFPSLYVGRRAVRSLLMDGAVSLILSKCNNLESIDFKFDQYFSPGIPLYGARFTSMLLRLSSVRRTYIRDIHPFACLKDVTLEAPRQFTCHEEHTELVLTQIIPCFYHPKILKLTIRRLQRNCLEGSFSWFPWQPQSSITHLNLLDTCIPAETLGKFLQACPVLESLKLGISSEQQDFHGPDYSRALLQVSNTLRQLSLGIVLKADAVMCLNVPEVLTGVFNLRYLSELEFLEIPIYLLIPPRINPHSNYLVTVLPGSIKSICFGARDILDHLESHTQLYHQTEWLFEQICNVTDYISFKRYYAPNLEMIRIVTRRKIKDGDKYFPTIKRECIKAGITFQIDHRYSFDDEWCEREPVMTSDA